MNNFESTAISKAGGLNFRSKAKKAKAQQGVNRFVDHREHSPRFWKSIHTLSPGHDPFNVWGKIGSLEMRITVRS